MLNVRMFGVPHIAEVHSAVPLAAWHTPMGACLCPRLWEEGGREGLGRASCGHPWRGLQRCRRSPCGVRSQSWASAEELVGGLFAEQPLKEARCYSWWQGNLHLSCFQILFQHELARGDWVLQLRTLIDARHFKVYSHNWYSWAGSPGPLL